MNRMLIIIKLQLIKIKIQIYKLIINILKKYKIQIYNKIYFLN